MSADLFKFNKTKTERTSTAPSASDLNGVPSLSDELFVELRDIIYKLSGIYYTESKKYLLEGRIQKRLSARKYKTYEDYISLLRSQRNSSELKPLFEAITINETYFFRAEHHFDAFEKIIVPEILKNRKNGFNQVFRIWSAASSSGEEAYTLAIIVLEKLKPMFPNITFQILASDINDSVINNARKGVYKEYAIRNIPKDLLLKYFKKDDGNYHLSDTVKNMVKFMNVNLYDNFQMSRITNCDIIFCANVLIYFDIPSKQKVLEHIYNSLLQGGYLFIGYSESLHGITKLFKLIHLPKAMAYKKE